MLRVRAEELSADEAAAFWPRVLRAAHLHVVFPNNRQFAVIQKDHAVGSVQDGRSVAGAVVLALAQSHNQWRHMSGGHQHVGKVFVEHHKGIGATHLKQSLANSFG